MLVNFSQDENVEKIYFESQKLMRNVPRKSLDNLLMAPDLQFQAPFSIQKPPTLPDCMHPSSSKKLSTKKFQLKERAPE